MKLRKVKAGALQLTLFIIVVIAILLSSTVLLIHIKTQFKVQSNSIIHTIKNTNEGINYGLISEFTAVDTITIEDLSSQNSSMQLFKERWGMFTKIISISKQNKNAYSKVALIGGRYSQNKRPALYMNDNGNPLVVVGSTKIEGLAFLPRRGVKSGNIAGVSYHNDELIYGRINESSEIPAMEENLSSSFSEIDQLYLKITNDNYLVLDYGKSYKNSFFKPSQIFYNDSNIDLDDIDVSGNIIIQSETKISISQSALLRDVLLIAPIIEIMDNVKGNFQAIASKEIIAGNNIDLSYPSVLAVLEQPRHVKLDSIENNSYKPKNEITIGKNTQVIGMVIYVGIEKSKNYSAQIFIDESAKIVGEVYCNLNLELKGQVLGSVFTNNFVALESGSIYQNHIYNGSIISRDLKNEYVGINFESLEKGIMKWLY